MVLSFQSFCGTFFGAKGNEVDIRTGVRPISQVKSNAADMIRQINETHRPIVITQNGAARGVLVDPHP